MKKKLAILLLFIFGMVIFTGCGRAKNDSSGSSFNQNDTKTETKTEIKGDSSQSSTGDADMDKELKALDDALNQLDNTDLDAELNSMN